MIALFRPYVADGSMKMEPDPRKQFVALARGKIRAAATQTNSLLDNIIATDTLKFAGPMVVTLLVPAMATHLWDSKTTDVFAKSMAKNRLDLCLLVMKKLENNYPAAALLYDLFVHANENGNLPYGIASKRGSWDSIKEADAENFFLDMGPNDFWNIETPQLWEGPYWEPGIVGWGESVPSSIGNVR